MASIIKDIGPVSAYALAVEHGFTGSEEEWAILQAQSGANAQRAEDAANSAAASAKEAADNIPPDYSEVLEKVNKLSEEIGNIGAPTDEQIDAAVRNYLTRPITVAWEVGGISSSSGTPTDNTTRMYTGMIDLNEFESVTIADTHQITWHAYSVDSTYLGWASVWLNNGFTRQDVLTAKPEAAYIRLLMKRISDDTMTAEDVTVSKVTTNCLVDFATKNEFDEQIKYLRERIAGEVTVGEWVRGNISSTTGEPTDNDNPTRMRSDFVRCYEGDVIKTEGYGLIYVYFYDPQTCALTGRADNWYAEYTIANDTLVRMVGGLATLANPNKPSTELTDDMIADFYVTILRGKEAKKEPRITQLPVLALEGDTSAMTKDNAVTLKYTLFDQTGTCTCKWQGSSSVRYVKKNYTIKLDNEIDGWAKWAAFVNSQRAANGNISKIPTESRWGAQKKFCTKANWIDPSHMRNIVNARLWGQIVQDRISNGEITDNRTLAPNYGAIDGFPIEITINGKSQGLYTLNIPKDGWQFAMADSATEYVVCAESNSEAACGWKALARLDEADYGVEYAADDVNTDTIKTSFNTAIQAALDAGADWETALAPYVDINSVFDYFIFASCLNHRDGISHNALYGTYDGVKWFMSAYDLDTTYGSDAYGTSWYAADNSDMLFAGVAKRHRLALLMHTHSKAKLAARYKELRAGILSDRNVWHTLSQFAVDISTRNYDVDREIWPTMPGTSTANMAQYMNFYRMHCECLDKEVEGWNV